MRPSALAVLKLITSSNLVGCSTRVIGRLGTLTGFGPRSRPQAESFHLPCAVGDEAASFRILLGAVDCRQPVLCSKADDPTRLSINVGLVMITTASARFAAIASNAFSKSPGPRASMISSCKPRSPAAVRTSVKSCAVLGVSGFQRKATRLSSGTNCLSSSICLANRSTMRSLTPVILPPGRAKLATYPLRTGSSPVIMTIGISKSLAWRRGLRAET